MKTKISLLLVIILFPLLGFAQSEQYTVISPDGNIKFTLTVDNSINISASYKGKSILDASEISMNLIDRVLGENAKVKSTKKRKILGVIHPVVKIKAAEVKNNCNELSLFFENNFYVVLRAYDEGFAYRFGTVLKTDITVMSETGKYRFPENYTLWWGKETTFQSHNQVYFDYKSIREVGSTDLASLPLILNPAKGPKIVITETDLVDYPGMWLRGNKDLSLHRVSAKYPKTIEKHSDRDLRITEREDYIAKTKGTRTFPWRIFAVAEDDGDLINNQLTYLLSTPSKMKNTNWIKSGKISWDWWNANNIYAVDFKAGINTETYKYYIDFASKYGIEYILLDEGWYKLGDLSAIVPDIDLKELISYGKKKNVGVIVWMVWKTLDEQLETLSKIEALGVKGIKVDFMNRDDQEMVNYYHKIARLAAEHHLMVDFHGSYKPAGLRRTFPNVMTREGVNGGEQFKWSWRQTPEHDLILPFGRMMAGPMDYTPGAMHNAQKKDFQAIFDTPMSMGTRCHQLAMYVCYESPLQMLCDAPSNYYKEPECMEFLSAVPSVWDQTLVLKAKVSDYLLIARRNDNNWYIGGMTDWDERDFDVNLSFLPKGKQYKMTLYRDGINANRIAIDFKQIKEIVDNTYNKKIHLAKGGGLAIMLEPIE